MDDPQGTRRPRDGARREALDALLPQIYDELRRIARAHMRGERTGHTLSTTALVHEAWIRLAGIQQVDWQDRTHFCATASRAMRRVLIDHARTRARTRRGGDAVHVSLDDADAIVVQRADELLALDDALHRLEAVNPRQARLVECRFFGGLTIEETADVLDVSVATAKRDWALCRAWLNRELRNAAPAPATG